MVSLASKIAGLGLASLLGGIFVVACGGDDGTRDPNTGGTGNTTGGTGNTTGGTGNTTGGTGNTTGGTGNTTGGTGNTTGGTTAGGALGAGPFPAAVCTPIVATEQITDFATLTVNNEWGTPAGFSGGFYGYPSPAETLAPPLTGMGKILAVVSDAALNVSGKVEIYSGFGLYFTPVCVDASAFEGVEFKIGGNVGEGGMLTFSIGTHTTAFADGMKGGCSVTTATRYSACVSPTTTITVPVTADVVRVPFTQPVGGIPATAATVDPAELTGMQWSFTWAPPTTMAYDVDVTVDDIKFYGGTGTGGAPGGGGAPGVGGADGVGGMGGTE